MMRRLWFAAAFLLIAGLIVGGLQLWPGKTAAPPAQPIELPPPPPVDLAEIVDLIPRDAIRAIDQPQFETAVEAASTLSPGERVIGLEINGDVRAYPINILSVHEVVNDVVGGEPVAITWCPLCYTAIVFSRRVESQPEPLILGVSGKLLNNTLVMFDRETDTLWSQLYGGGIDGPLRGQPLAVFPSLHTEWEAWRQQHPDTQVLSKRLTCAQFKCSDGSADQRGAYATDSYAGYYNSADKGVINAQIPRGLDDDGPKARVLGVRLGGTARAYPVDVLRDQPLIHDEINGVPVLVWYDPAAQAGAAFVRRLGEQTLTFTLSPADPGRLVDVETGSQWDAASGMSVAGQLEGTRLPPLITTTAFAFGWYDYFPQSETFGKAEDG